MLIQPIAEKIQLLKYVLFIYLLFLHKYSHIHMANFSKLFIGYIYVY